MTRFLLPYERIYSLLLELKDNINFKELSAIVQVKKITEIISEEFNHSFKWKSVRMNLKRSKKKKYFFSKDRSMLNPKIKNSLQKQKTLNDFHDNSLKFTEKGSSS